MSWKTFRSGTDADLILLETAVNDGFSPASISTSEALLRSLLSLPSNPAVVYVDSFGQNSLVGGRVIQNGGDAHNHLAVRYDVPQISLRAAALNAMMAQRGERGEEMGERQAEGGEGAGLADAWFKGDQKHITVPMHEMLGQLVVAYLDEQLCELRRGGWEKAREEWVADEGLPGMDTLGEMPQVSSLPPAASARATR